MPHVQETFGRASTHMVSHKHTHIHIHTRKHIHTYTRTRTHTHTKLHTHTDTLIHIMVMKKNISLIHWTNKTPLKPEELWWGNNMRTGTWLTLETITHFFDDNNDDFNQHDKSKYISTVKFLIAFLVKCSLSYWCLDISKWLMIICHFWNLHLVFNGNNKSGMTFKIYFYLSDK